MAWLPISGVVPQSTENGNQANGMVLKFYEPGTVTPLAVTTDSTGGTLTTEFVLDTQGRTTLSSVIVVPHVDQNYKIVLYLNQADADANATGSAVYVVDNLNGAGGVLTSQSNTFNVGTTQTFDKAIFNDDTVVEGLNIKDTMSANTIAASNASSAAATADDKADAAQSTADSALGGATFNTIMNAPSGYVPAETIFAALEVTGLTIGERYMATLVSKVLNTSADSYIYMDLLADNTDTGSDLAIQYATTRFIGSNVTNIYDSSATTASSDSGITVLFNDYAAQLTCECIFVATATGSVTPRFNKSGSGNFQFSFAPTIFTVRKF